MGPGTGRCRLLAARRALSGIATCVLLVGVYAGSARADTTVAVNTASDSPTPGQCSLREAVAYADGTSEPACAPQAASGTTTINVPPGTYTLTGGGLSITANTAINGQGAASTIVDGGNSFQVFNVAINVQVTMSQITITRGESGTTSTGCTSSGFFSSCPAEDGINGGGIANAGTLTLARVAVTGNAASQGTRPFSFPILFCFGLNCPGRDGASAGQGGWGGGIDNTGTLTIASSTISNNAAGAGGDGSDGVSGTGGDAGAGHPGGSGGQGGYAGGIFNESGARLTITSSTLSGNSAGRGGNAGAGSSATANGTGGNAGFPSSAGGGGAVLNEGTMSITDSTITGNHSGVGGNGATGGIGMSAANGSGSASANGGHGGGVYNAASQTVAFTNDTIVGNTASAGGTGGMASGAGGNGGAIYQGGLGLVQLSFDTITGNVAAANAGAVDNASVGTVTEAASIIASNTGAPSENCIAPSSPITDLGSNIVFGDNSCPGRNTDPGLGPLSGNGGPAQTRPLLPGSAAIDAVPSNACPVTTDERGVGRPHGAACDAGAYEFAPPTVGTPGATAASPTIGTVTAAINPNLTSRDTTVTVRYGTTSAYGFSAATQDIGAGVSPVAFSTDLGGLKPATTYHFDIIASNGDGTTTTVDQTFTTARAMATTISKRITLGPKATLTLVCSGGIAGSVCAGPIRLTAHVTSLGKSFVGVSASTTKKKPKPKKGKPKQVTKTVTVGTGSFRAATGHTTTAHLKLNATGTKLLSQFYKLPVKVQIGGAAPTTKALTFSYARLHIVPAYQWAFSTTFAFATQLAVSGLPHRSQLAVVCRGSGCPFARKSFAAPKRGRLDLARALKQRHLGVGSTVDLQITATNTVGEVVRFTVLSGKLPKESFLCLPPGTRTPSACAS